MKIENDRLWGLIYQFSNFRRKGELNQVHKKNIISIWTRYRKIGASGSSPSPWWGNVRMSWKPVYILINFCCLYRFLKLSVLFIWKKLLHNLPSFRGLYYQSSLDLVSYLVEIWIIFLKLKVNFTTCILDYLHTGIYVYMCIIAHMCILTYLHTCILTYLHIHA